MVSTTLTRWSCSNLILSYCWFSHDVTKVQTVKQAVLQFYFHDVYVLEQLKTNIHTNFCFERIFGFVVEYTLYAWIQKLMLDEAFTWRPRDNGKFWEKDLKTTTKHEWRFLNPFKAFWEIAGENLSVPHSQQDWWKSSQPGRCIYNLQPDLLGRFTADVCPDITDQFGCGHREKFGPSVGRGD